MNFEEQCGFHCLFDYLLRNGSGNNGVLSENLKIIFAVYLFININY